MKRFACSIVFIALIGLVLSFIGSSSVSAKPAETGKGLGCYVRTTDEGDDDYVRDATCKVFEVLKLDEDGDVEFWFYQDHGQTSWHPERTYRSTFEQCLNFGSLGIVCGTVKETITPSGEYKSSFKSN
jgi:hypothetical protein